MSDDSTGFDPAQDIKLDAVSLRVLAHPLRVRLLSALRLYGPATASQLAARLAESSGATSYHLRRLALHGFVAEEPELGTRRERWWRAVHRTTRFDMTLDEQTRAIGGEYLRAVAHNYSNRMVEFADCAESVADRYGAGWEEVFTLSDWTLQLSVERAAELHREVFELMRRYRDEPGGAPASTLIAQVQLFPVPRPA
jgi:DNA-binding transcriptional ArsR family regulator